MKHLAWVLSSLVILAAPVGRSTQRHALGAETSPIRRDEVVVFYPTIGRQAADGSSWRLAIHGSIYEPEPDSAKRAALVAMLKRALDLDMTPAEAKTFDRRVRRFLVDNERGKKISIRLGEKTRAAGRSEPNGHFSAEVQLTKVEVDEFLRQGKARDGWLWFVAETRSGDDRRFLGRVRLIEPVGLSVISDVDDTIKITLVRDRKAMLANTFLRPFQPVPEMAPIYRALASGGAAFHYLSASPWQLYEPLSEFQRAEGFPAGTFHLKYFRLTDSSFWDLFGSQEQYKSRSIEDLLAAFPQRRFLLIGDTGEQDPEIYGRLACRHPEQVVGIWLRNVTGETDANPRMTQAREGLPPKRWRLFKAPKDLEPAIADVLRHARP